MIVFGDASGPTQAGQQANKASWPLLFHWLSALLMLTQLALGWWMLTLPKSPPGLRAGWFNLHKSLGLTILVVALLWLACRRWNRPPDAGPHWQQLAAQLNHALVFACMLVIALSGYLGSSFTRYPVLYFGWALPAWGGDWPAGKEVMSQLHAAAVWLLTGLLLVHVAAALWHWVHGHPATARIGLPRFGRD